LLGISTNNPAETAVLETILNELPNDDDWDEEVPIQRGYKKAGLKRYKIDHALLSQANMVTGEKQELTANIDKVGRLSSSGAASSKDGAIRVKLENPEYESLKGLAKVIQSAEKKVNQLLMGLKKDRATMLAKVGPEGQLDPFSRAVA